MEYTKKENFMQWIALKFHTVTFSSGTVYPKLLEH